MKQRFRVAPTCLGNTYKVIDDNNELQPIELLHVNDAFTVCRALNAMERQEADVRNNRKKDRLKSIVKEIIKEMRNEQ